MQVIKQPEHGRTSFDWSDNTGGIDVKMDGYVEENHLLRCWGWLPLLNWIGSYIISIVKTASKNIGALICSMKFLSPEIALYLYKVTIYPCMEYCCYVWASAPSCYLELLDKDTVINSTPNADISKKHENRFFLIRLKIFYIQALNFPHVYWRMLHKVWNQNFAKIWVKSQVLMQK